MKKIPKFTKTQLKVNNGRQGETLEAKVFRALNNGENLEGGGEIIYTAKRDGILPQYNIRTDKQDIAVDAMDKIAKGQIFRQEERWKTDDEASKENKENVGDEPTQGGDN